MAQFGLALNTDTSDFVDGEEIVKFAVLVISFGFRCVFDTVVVKNEGTFFPLDMFVRQVTGETAPGPLKEIVLFPIFPVLLALKLDGVLVVCCRGLGPDVRHPETGEFVDSGRVQQELWAGVRRGRVEAVCHSDHRLHGFQALFGVGEETGPDIKLHLVELLSVAVFL